MKSDLWYLSQFVIIRFMLRASTARLVAIIIILGIFFEDTAAGNCSVGEYCC